MTDEPNTASPTNTTAETEKQHPLLAAFHDMKRVAVTQRGLKILARIQFGIENRERWIENRQSQINRLHKLSADALEAYDRGDDEDMKQVLREVEGIVGMSEGVSAADSTACGRPGIRARRQRLLPAAVNARTVCSATGPSRVRP